MVDLSVTFSHIALFADIAVNTNAISNTFLILL